MHLRFVHNSNEGVRFLLPSNDERLRERDILTSCGRCDLQSLNQCDQQRRTT
jgi:hypothetical protein